MKTKKRRARRAVIVLICIAAAGALLGLAADLRVRSVGKSMIVDADSAAADGDFDCILVLGCGVRDDGTPSPMLRDRLLTAIALYEAGAAPKLLMSGDHGRDDYDEVNAMKNFAIGQGVPAEDIFLDHAGFSTYDSVYRAQAVFCVERAIIVTQRYHLYRALYIARRLGLDAVGVDACLQTYSGQTARDVREVLARCKDLCKCVFRPEPTFLGDQIPIDGDGNATAG
jgi:vancomycin permeability regulator SanA